MYISEVEGLLMYNPAVFLHKGQKLRAAQDTAEILSDVASGKLVLLREDETSTVNAETSEPESRQEAKHETTQAMEILHGKVTESKQIVEKAPEEGKPTRRGSRK